MLRQIRRVGQRAALYAVIRQELMAEALEAATPPGDDGDFNIDFRNERMTFGQFAEGRGRLLASIAVEPATLLWAHSSIMRDQMGSMQAGQRVLEFGHKERLQELTQEEVPYETPADADQADHIASIAHDVGAVGIQLHGPQALYYTFPTNRFGSRMAVLVEDLSVDVRYPTIEDLMVKLPRLSASLDDLAWSLCGFTNLLRWQLDTRGRQGEWHEGYRVTDADGRFIVVDVKRDELNRVVHIAVNGVHSPEVTD